MPYAPGINDISGQLLAQGITSAAESAAAGHEKYLLTQKEIAALTGTATFAAQKGLLTPEELAEFNAGNIGKKREIASKAGMLYKDYLAEEERKVLQLTPEELALYGRAGVVPLRTSAHSFTAAPLPEQPFALPPDVADRARKAGYEPVPTSRGHVQFLPVAGDDTPAFTLTPEEIAQYKQAGVMPLRVSKGAFNVMPLPTQRPAAQLQDVTMPDGRVIKVAIQPDGKVTQIGGNGPAPVKPLSSTDAILASAKVAELQGLDKEIAQLQQGKGWVGVFDTKAGRAAKLTDLATKRAAAAAFLTNLGLDETGQRPQPAAPAKPLSSANKNETVLDTKDPLAIENLPGGEILPPSDALRGPGQDGYVPGRKYPFKDGPKLYLGGNPKDGKNWR